MAETLQSGARNSGRIPIMVTASERWRLRWGRRLAVWGTLAILLSIAGAYLAPKAYKSAKRWKAHRLLENARVQKEGGDQNEMRALLMRAYLLDENDDQVLRAMAEDYSRTPMEKLQFLQKLSLNKDTTLEDRLKLCRLAVDNRLTSFASADFDKLMSDLEARKNPEVSELCARYLTLKGQWAEALKWTHGGVREDTVKEGKNGEAQSATIGEKLPVGAPSEHPKLNILRAKLLLDAPQPDQKALAAAAREVKLLLEAAMMSGTEEISREASLLLAKIYVTTPTVRQAVGADAAEGLLKTLEKWSSEPRWEARLMAADLQIFLNESGKNAVVDQLLALAPKVDEATQQELARWLTRRNEAAHAQKLAESGPQRIENRDWFLIRVDAMASQKKWKEIETILLNTKGVPVEESIGRLFLWRCAKEAGNKESELSQRLAQTLAACKDSPASVCFYIAGYLEQAGERMGAALIYRRLTENEESEGPAYVGLVRCLSADPRQTSALRDALEKMLTKFPSVKEAQNDLAYLNLLEGRKLVESIRTARDLVTDAPGMLMYRTSMALAELVQGNVKAAESMYRGVELDWTTLNNPGWVAVRAAVLGASGKKDEARLLADPINPKLLRDGEQRLLDRYVFQTTPKDPKASIPTPGL